MNNLFMTRWVITKSVVSAFWMVGKIVTSSRTIGNCVEIFGIKFCSLNLRTSQIIQYLFILLHKNQTRTLKTTERLNTICCIIVHTLPYAHNAKTFLNLKTQAEVVRRSQTIVVFVLGSIRRQDRKSLLSAQQALSYDKKCWTLNKLEVG